MSARRGYGSGTVYRRTVKDARGKKKPVGSWLIKYYVGKSVRYESSGSTAKEDAQRLLTVRMGEALERGEAEVSTDPAKVTFENLAALVEADYIKNGNKSLARVKQAIRHLREELGMLTAPKITVQRVDAYIARRFGQGAKPSTVRIEVNALRRGFKLAFNSEMVTRVPAFTSPQVRNTRTGFFEPRELRAVIAHLPGYMKPFVEFLSLTGWRAGEAIGLTWKDVDFDSGMVRLEPGTTKNDEGRTFPFAAHPRLAALLEEERARVEAMQHELGRVIRWVFPQDNGTSIGDYSHGWHTACKRAGVPGKLVHDLRRTAVRALERAGISRSVAMKLTGHRTEAVYRRYAIVCEADLSAAVAQLAALHASESGPIVAKPLRGDANPTENKANHPAHERLTNPFVGDEARLA